MPETYTQVELDAIEANLKLQPRYQTTGVSEKRAVKAQRYVDRIMKKYRKQLSG